MSDAEMSDDKSRERDRMRRADKTSRFSDNNRERSRDNRNKRGEHRVYVSNIAYEYRWQDLKDLFRTHVGDNCVTRVELFVDDNDKSRGCGIVELADEKAVKKALSVMHRYDLKGRKLVVRDDSGNVRDKFGNISNGRRGGGGDRDLLPDLRDDHMRIPQGLMGNSMARCDTYGLSPQFLEELEIRGPLLHRVFVANLDYKVDDSKLKEVFKLAGKIVSCELARDKDGNSRGFAVIEYDHPVESVQAISMLNGQQLYDRKLIVRMDKSSDNGPGKLPEGLRGIGLGLGPNGDPLKDVSRNLPNGGGDSGVGSGILGHVPASALGLSAAGLGSVGGNSLANIANTQAAALQLGLQNQMLQGGLNSVANELALAANLRNSGLNAASLVSNSLANSNFGGLSGSGAGLGLDRSSNNFNRLESNFHSASLTNPGGGRNTNAFDNFDSNGMGGRSNNDGDFRQGSTFSTTNNGSQRGNVGNLAARMGDTIIVSNLPPTASWNLLREKFRNFGEIVVGEMKGTDVGVIQFSDPRSAKEAVEMMDRARVEGRTIDVRFF